MKTKHYKPVNKTLPDQVSIPRGSLFLALSFIIPFLLLGIAFAQHDVYPFGNRQILITDFWQQYYAFFSDYWHKLRDGSSLLWSWSTGVGSNYLALIAYYLASPLNLFIALFPHEWLREVLVIILLTKVGLAGLFFAMYLRYAFRRCDLSLPMFASFYALCAFTLGYYWNIMWFDTFALLPLVMLGVLALVKEGHFILYVVSLALSVFANYYIGFFTCIFTAIMFFTHCFTLRLDKHVFFKRFTLIITCSIIALGLTTILTLPAFFSLQDSYSAVNKFPSTYAWYRSFINIIGNFIAFTPPTDKEGLPNLYCGLLSLLLTGVFMRSSKISWREKLIYPLVLAFILISCNLNVLYYIWNGLHFTNMIPFRFSFLASFLMAIMGYRAYTLLEKEISWWDMAAMAIAATFFIGMAFLGEQEQSDVIKSIIVVGIYFILFIFRKSILKVNSKAKRSIYNHVATILLAAVVVTETFISTQIGVETVGTTDRTSYPLRYETVQELLGMRETKEADFYRTELTTQSTRNAPSIYGYDGVSLFSSTVNVSTTYFLTKLGLPGRDYYNQYRYAETSPLTNAFLNIKYLMASSNTGAAADKTMYWEPVGESDGGLLLENKRYLPLGFMVDESLASYTGDRDNPFTSQNELFRLATDLDEDLFTIIDMTHVGHKNYYVTRNDLGVYKYTLNDTEQNGKLKWNYTPPMDGPLYVYCKIDNLHNADVLLDNVKQRSVDLFFPYIFCAGVFKEGDLASITGDLSAEKGNATIYVAFINQELLDQGYALLADETLELTAFSDTYVKGTVTAKTDGLLYTSIPYEKGWNVYVDGLKADVTLIDDCMPTVKLTAGTHTIEYRYFNKVFLAGMCITLLSLAVFIFIIFKDKDRREKIIYMYKMHKEKLNYLFFGILTTIINWVIYGMLVRTVWCSISVANLLAWTAAIVVAFITNKLYVFSSKSWQPRQVARECASFLGARLVSGLVELGGVPLLVFIGLGYPLLGIEGFVAKILVSVIVIILNYIFSKIIVFRNVGKKNNA